VIRESVNWVVLMGIGAQDRLGWVGKSPVFRGSGVDMERVEIAEPLLLCYLVGGLLSVYANSPVLGPVWLIEFRVFMFGIAANFDPIKSFCLKFGGTRISLFIVGCINSALPFSLLVFSSVSLPAGFILILK